MWKFVLTVLFVVIFIEDIDIAEECQVEETFMYDGLLMVWCHDNPNNLPELEDEVEPMP